MRSLCVGLTFVLAAACSHSHDGYTAFQDCFDDHTMEEGLAFDKAIIVCCLDHEIDGQKLVCGATAADCVTYLGANLTSSATQAEVQATCDEYVIEKGE